MKNIVPPQLASKGTICEDKIWHFHLCPRTSLISPSSVLWDSLRLLKYVRHVLLPARYQAKYITTSIITNYLRKIVTSCEWISIHLCELRSILCPHRWSWLSIPECLQLPTFQQYLYMTQHSWISVQTFYITVRRPTQSDPDMTLDLKFNPSTERHHPVVR